MLCCCIAAGICGVPGGQCNFVKGSISGMRNVCIEDGAGWWDARSPGVRDELHTSASDRLSRCVTEETLFTCLLIITLRTHTFTVYPRSYYIISLEGRAHVRSSAV